MKAILLTFSLWVCIIINVKAQSLVEVDSIAPEIVYVAEDGTELKLSDLRGKMVLVDFWASWCKPCRRETPYLIEAYKNYKNARFDNGRGFEIFSVSLDANKESWEKAIVADNMTWNYHVSDLKGWYSDYAKLYGVKSIPASFLIDGNGVVIATNLRGDKLETILKKKKKTFFFGKNDT